MYLVLTVLRSMRYCGGRLNLSGEGLEESGMISQVRQKHGVECRGPCLMSSQWLKPSCNTPAVRGLERLPPKV